jgi:succinate-acetate transporter protein
MSQYPVGRQASEYDVERAGPQTANADRLGLSVLGFVTVLLGCYYVGFSAPTIALSRFAFGAILTASGIVEILAGMWAFRKNTETTANIFTAYGGFLIIAGYLFIATGGLIPLLATGILHVVFGLLFLCWFFMGAVLWLGSARTNSMLRLAVAVLLLSYLILAIGHFAFDNRILFYIGGWLAIISGFVAWLGVAMHSLGISKIEENLPSRSEMEQRLEATD